MEGVAYDLVSALRIYEKACTEYDYGHSCYKAATYKTRGRACQQNWVRGSPRPT